MKSIFDYRVVIMDENAEIIAYEQEFGKLHQECLNDYVRKKGYNISCQDYFLTSEEIVKKGNAVFYNNGNKMMTVILPENMTKEQLYKLDYIENWFKGAEYIGTLVLSNTGESIRDYSFYIDEKNPEAPTPQERFSEEVIQSYYIEDTKRRK